MKELKLKLLRNNFTLWKEATYDELALSNEAEYIDFILTGVQWTQQEIMERDYLPTFGDGIELTAAEKKAFRSSHSTKKLDEWARARKTILPRIAVAIRMSLSKEIEEDLKGHPDYAAWKGLAAGINGRGTDPHGLLNMLTDICGRKRFADNEVLQAIDNNDMRVRLHTNKQLFNESSVSYKQRFEELAKEMKNCGLTIPNELELAVIFAEGLKQGTRQRKYMDELKSKCAHCPEDYPKSIAEVWKIVTNVTVQDHSIPVTSDRSKREDTDTLSQTRLGKQIPNNSSQFKPRNAPMRAAEPNRPNIKEPAAGADQSKTRQIMTITADIPDTESTYSSADICSGENNLIMLSSVTNKVGFDHYSRQTVNDSSNTSISPNLDPHPHVYMRGGPVVSPGVVRKHYSRQTVNDSSNTSILPNIDPHPHVYMRGGLVVSPGVMREMNHITQPEGVLDASYVTPKSDKIRIENTLGDDLERDTPITSNDHQQENDISDNSDNNTPNNRHLQISDDKKRKPEYEYVLLSEVLRMDRLPPNMFDHQGNRVPIKQSENYMLIEDIMTCGTSLKRAYWKMNTAAAIDECQDRTGEDVSVYMLRSLDDDKPPEVKPDFDKHEYVNKHLLRVKESTHVYVDDNITIKSLGEGLFSEINIPQCTPIINFQGKVISMCTAKTLTFPDNEYIIKLDAEWVLDCKANARGDSTPRCLASKSNDPYRAWCTTKRRHLTKADANAGAIRVYDGKEYHCVLYAIKDIKAGEEIMWNYLYDACEDEQIECTHDQAVTEPRSTPDNVHQVLTAKKLSHMDGIDIFKTDLRCKSKRVRDHTLLLDSQAGMSVFKDEILLENLRVFANPINIAGINSKGPPILVKHEGDHKYLGAIAVCRDASANILSLAEMVDKGHEVTYNKIGDRFTLQPNNPESGPMIFIRNGKHYTHFLDSGRTTKNQKREPEIISAMVIHVLDPTDREQHESIYDKLNPPPQRDTSPSDCEQPDYSSQTHISEPVPNLKINEIENGGIPPKDTGGEKPPQMSADNEPAYTATSISESGTLCTSADNEQTYTFQSRCLVMPHKPKDLTERTSTEYQMQVDVRTIHGRAFVIGLILPQQHAVVIYICEKHRIHDFRLHVLKAIIRITKVSLDNPIYAISAGRYIKDLLLEEPLYRADITCEGPGASQKLLVTRIKQISLTTSAILQALQQPKAAGSKHHNAVVALAVYQATGRTNINSTATLPIAQYIDRSPLVLPAYDSKGHSIHFGSYIAWGNHDVNCRSKPPKQLIALGARYPYVHHHPEPKTQVIAYNIQEDTVVLIHPKLYTVHTESFHPAKSFFVICGLLAGSPMCPLSDSISKEAIDLVTDMQYETSLTTICPCAHRYNKAETSNSRDMHTTDTYPAACPPTMPFNSTLPNTNLDMSPTETYPAACPMTMPPNTNSHCNPVLPLTARRGDTAQALYYAQPTAAGNTDNPTEDQLPNAARNTDHSPGNSSTEAARQWLRPAPKKRGVSTRQEDDSSEEQSTTDEHQEQAHRAKKGVHCKDNINIDDEQQKQEEKGVNKEPDHYSRQTVYNTSISPNLDPHPHVYMRGGLVVSHGVMGGMDTHQREKGVLKEQPAPENTTHADANQRPRNRFVVKGYPVTDVSGAYLHTEFMVSERMQEEQRNCDPKLSSTAKSEYMSQATLTLKAVTLMISMEPRRSDWLALGRLRAHLEPELIAMGHLRPEPEGIATNNTQTEDDEEISDGSDEDKREK